MMGNIDNMSSITQGFKQSILLVLELLQEETLLTSCIRSLNIPAVEALVRAGIRYTSSVLCV